MVYCTRASGRRGVSFLCSLIWATRNPLMAFSGYTKKVCINQATNGQPNN
jgi:hypothetical protein